ncbi:MAG: protease HtpX [Granulosicoccus sp.]
MSRFILFMATNMAVMLVFSIVTAVFGLDDIIGASNLSLIIYATIFGFVGSFISLFMSKSMAIRSMRVQLIDQPTNETERWLQETVHAQAKAAGIGMPDVGIFQQASPNAFATGWNKNDSLVAVSTGLLETMSKKEVEAVLGHEVAHVYNGDMVTMGLIQGVLNTFVIIFSRILGKMMSGNRGGSMGYLMGNILGNVVFGFLASLIAAWFSRQREFRADAGGAKLAGRENMISALAALKRGSGQSEPLPDKQLAAFGISGPNLARLTSTHPPLDVRIARLRAEA